MLSVRDCPIALSLYDNHMVYLSCHVTMHCDTWLFEHGPNYARDIYIYHFDYVCMCRVPYYSPLKLGFLLWLQMPRFGGAYRLTSLWIRPFLHKYYLQIDELLHYVHVWLNRSEVWTFTDGLQEVLSMIPVLEWFMRGPDGRPWSPPSRPSQNYIE